MNIIKENMFFVVMGVVVLLALLLFAFIVQPLKSSNRDLQQKVQALKASLDRTVGEGPAGKQAKELLPNKAAIKEAEEYRRRYEEQFNSLKAGLAKMCLGEKLVVDPRDPKMKGLENADQSDPGTFKSLYGMNTEALVKQLDEKHIAKGPMAWHFWNWGESVPKDKEDLQRVVAAKELSLMRELMAIITSPELHVMQLDRLEINPGETRSGDYKPPAMKLRVEPYFDVFPFVIEIWMPFHQHEILLKELLRSKPEIPIYIRKVSMMRIEDDPRITKKIPPLYVGIRVDGWALDYRPQGKKTAPTGVGPYPMAGPPAFGQPPR